MEQIIRSLVLQSEKISEMVFKNESLTIIWSVCLILMIIIWATELFVKKVMKYDYIDNNILKRIFLAIESCNTIEAIQLLQKYPNYVNSNLGTQNYTPFLIACFHGNTLLVKYMLQMNADIKSKTKRGETAFFLAIAHLINNPFSIDASCIRELFYAGCDVNEPNAKGYASLHLAAHFGHKTLVKWLLEKGANTRVTPSPIEIASNKVAGDSHRRDSIYQMNQRTDEVGEFHQLIQELLNEHPDWFQIMAAFTEENDEFLVELISQNPPLYDSRLKTYKDNDIRDNIWEHIGKKLNRTSHLEVASAISTWENRRRMIASN